MDDNGETREDLKLPTDADLATEIKTKFEKDDQLMVTVLKAMDEEAVVGTKQMTNK